MLGGRLSALYQQNGIRAWFVAYADFLVAWQPLHYDAAIGVRIGVAYMGTVAGISVNFGVELSADVHLWGPPLAGKAEIHWSFISFTIYLGQYEQPPTAKALEWGEFANAFLPPGDESLTINAVEGVLKKKQALLGEKQIDVFVVNPYQLKLLIKSTVPSTRIEANGSSPEVKDSDRGKPKTTSFGIRPMQIQNSPAPAIPAGPNWRLESSHLKIRVFPVGNEKTSVSMIANEVIQNVPGALWGQGQPSIKDPQLIDNVLTGTELHPPGPTNAGEPCPMENFDKLLEKVSTQNPEVKWAYTYADTAPAYEPWQVIQYIRTKEKDDLTHRYELLRCLKRQGWVKEIPEESTLAETYQKMQFAPPHGPDEWPQGPVGCPVGWLPQFPRKP
jgi:hypothetical protein